MPAFGGADVAELFVGLQHAQVVPNAGVAQVHGLRQGFDSQAGLLFQGLQQQFLGGSLAFLWCFFGVFWASFEGRAGPFKTGDKQSGDFAELHTGGVFENQGHAAAPGFDHVNAPEQVCNQRVAAVRDVAPAHGFKGQAIKQAAGVADFDPVFVNGDLDVVGLTSVAVAKGVDDGLS